MANLKIEDIQTLETVSFDELNQVVGGWGKGKGLGRCRGKGLPKWLDYGGRGNRKPPRGNTFGLDNNGSFCITTPGIVANTAIDDEPIIIIDDPVVPGGPLDNGFPIA